MTGGDTLEEALADVKDAVAAVIETYEDLGKPFPQIRTFAKILDPLSSGSRG